MRMKLIVALVSDEKTNAVVDAARTAGATGATIITAVRGEGLKPGKTFFGLDLEAQRDVVFFLVTDAQARHILEHIRDVAHIDVEPGAGVVFQLAIEDVVGLATQMHTLLQETGGEI